ncbi:hypothetical protein B0H19DRAFT_196624 [Mycena capillaripes]|nr:hypothetical protein B0H19DRAFT_196624 [Mycena capillaripes]
MSMGALPPQPLHCTPLCILPPNVYAAPHRSSHFSKPPARHLPSPSFSSTSKTRYPPGHLIFMLVLVSKESVHCRAVCLGHMQRRASVRVRVHRRSGSGHKLL